MNLSIQSNVSGMQAFSKQIAVSAGNVANALSDNFKADRVTISQGENSQVKALVTPTTTPGPLVEDPLKSDGSLKELSNTDIAEEFVQQISARHGFDANARTIKAYDETLGSLIDLMG